MKIGILSDTHGHILLRTETALRLLVHQEIEAVFHCGDVGSERVLIELATHFNPLDIPVYAILGNMDCYNESLERYPDDTGIYVKGYFAEVALAGKQIAMAHGHDMLRLQSAIRSEKYDYFLPVIPTHPVITMWVKPALSIQSTGIPCFTWAHNAYSPN